MSEFKTKSERERDDILLNYPKDKLFVVLAPNNGHRNDYYLFVRSDGKDIDLDVMSIVGTDSDREVAKRMGQSINHFVDHCKKNNIGVTEIDNREGDFECAPGGWKYFPLIKLISGNY